MNSFKELNIKQSIKDAIAEIGYETPTPVQAEAIPPILEGKDCLAQAPTGTGKTCAFGVPLVNKANASERAVQAVVLCPTRELAMQTEKELKKLAARTEGIKVAAVYGGQNIDRQFALLRKQPQIVVGTPGRIIDHLKRRTIKFDKVNTVVLDEADEMLDLGFRDDIDAILGEMPDERQTLLFSATIPNEIAQISSTYQHEPVRITTTFEGEKLPPIVQYYLKLKETTKIDAFKRIMEENGYTFVLVFVNTKRKATDLSEKLIAEGFNAACLHGDLRQSVRDRVMRTYRAKELTVLVATDVAARGIDVNNIEAIFNYDLPLDEEFYIHRIGRTARANNRGVAFNFATSRDYFRLNIYEKLTDCEMEELVLDGLTDVKICRTADEKKAVESGRKFFLNVGTKDRLDADKIKNYILSRVDVEPKDIQAVKLLDTYSFVTVSEAAAKFMTPLSGEMFAGRRLSVEEASLPKKAVGSRGGSQGRGNSSYGKGKSEGGRGRYNSDRPRRENDGEKSYGGRSKSYGDKPRNSDGDKPKTYGDRSKSYGERSKDYSDKPKYNSDRPTNVGASEGEKTYSDRPKNYSDRTKRYGDKPKSYGDKSRTSYGDRSKSYGDKPRYSDGENTNAERPRYNSDRPKTYGDKPRYSEGDKPKTYGDKPRYSDSDKPKSYAAKSKSYGDKPAYGKGKSYGGGKSYGTSSFKSGAKKRANAPKVTFGDDNKTNIYARKSKKD